MLQAYLRLTKIGILLSLLLPTIVIVCSRLMSDVGVTARFFLSIALTLGAAAVAYPVIAWGLRKLRPHLEDATAAQALFLDQLPPRWVTAAIVTFFGWARCITLRSPMTMFAVLSNDIGRKIYLMMTEAFDGRPPLCVQAYYDGAVIFLQKKRGDLTIDPGLIERAGFHDITTKYANPALRADVSTDDWPFFYMPRRVYPVTYLYMMAMIVIVSAYLFYSFTSARPRVSNASFFLLGAGFMLVETKGITELGLVFGNTWQVIGIVISGILVMAFLANLLVQRLRLHRPLVPYLLLLTSLLVGWWVAGAGGFPSTTSGRIAAVVVLTCPLLFSGMVFSTLLAGTTDLAAVLAVNLLGAMVGGMLEYNSMYFGFRFLYLLAIVLYGAAFVMGIAGRSGAQGREPSLVPTA
jgi:hypothetical protein